VDRRNLAESVADHIGQLIVTGELAPDPPVREQHWVDRLGVSRGSLREALLVLERQHLVVLSPGRGARVSPLDLHWIREIHEVWHALFGLLLRRMAEQGPETLAGLAPELATLDDPALRGDRFAARAMDLVDHIAEVIGDGVLSRQLKTLMPAARRCFQFAIDHAEGEAEATRQFASTAFRLALQGDRTGVMLAVTRFADEELDRLGTAFPR